MNMDRSVPELNEWNMYRKALKNVDRKSPVQIFPVINSLIVEILLNPLLNHHFLYHLAI